MLRLLSLLSFFLILLILINFGKSNQLSMDVSADSPGKISGLILDQNNAVIILPKPQIQFVSSAFQKTVSIDADGMYEVSLPSGIYSVKLDIKGYHSLIRSMIKVDSGKDYNLNLIPAPIYSTLGTTLYENESVDRLTIPPKYETLFRNDKVISDIKPVIQYQTKTESANGAEYENVTLSYNFLTIYADKMSYKKAVNTLEYIGKSLVAENEFGCSTIKNFKIRSVSGNVSFEFSCN